MKLQQLDQLPEALLNCAATDLQTILGAPTLLHLQGRQSQPLFVSVLMHGNETTGLGCGPGAPQKILAKWRAAPAALDEPLYW